MAHKRSGGYRVSPQSRLNIQYYEEDEKEFDFMEMEPTYLSVWKAFDNLAFVICKTYERIIFQQFFPDGEKMMKLLKDAMRLGEIIFFVDKHFDYLYQRCLDTEKRLQMLAETIENQKEHMYRSKANGKSYRPVASVVDFFSKNYDEICGSSAQSIRTTIERLFERYSRMNKPFGLKLTHEQKELVQRFLLLTTTLVLKIKLLDDNSELERID